LKIIFFAPFSGIWVHSFAEALIAESLAQNGHEIVYISCGRLYSKLCNVMRCYNFNFSTDINKKNKICHLCENSNDIIIKNFKFKNFNLAGKLQPQDVEYAKKITSGVTNANYLSLVIDGIEIGRIALYEVLLRFKKTQLTKFSEEEWSEYIAELEHALLTYSIMKRVFAQEKPDRLILHNALYSVNHICCELARKFGIIDYESYATGNLFRRYERLTIGRGGRINVNRYCLDHWEKYKEIPASMEYLQIAVSHQLELFKGTNAFAYSPSKSAQPLNIREIFKISDSQKIFVAVMSSYDEIFAAQTIGLEQTKRAPVFESQVDWIKALIEYFSPRPELFLVIRVHPREFPNKREGVKSEHASILEKIFNDLPSNITVNWPGQNISLYEFAEYTNVFLCAWSSVAKEMTLLGIPVVTYFIEFLCYPADLTYVGNSKPDYFDKLEKALCEGWSIEHARKTLRWMVLEYCYSAFTVADSFNMYNEKKSKIIILIFKIMSKIFNYNFLHVSDCKTRAPRLLAGNILNKLIVSEKNSILDVLEPSDIKLVTKEEETKAIKILFKQILEALYTEKINSNENSLNYKLHSFVNDKNIGS